MNTISIFQQQKFQSLKIKTRVKAYWSKFAQSLSYAIMTRENRELHHFLARLTFAEGTWHLPEDVTHEEFSILWKNILYIKIELHTQLILEYFQKHPIPKKKCSYPDQEQQAQLIQLKSKLKSAEQTDFLFP